MLTRRAEDLALSPDARKPGADALLNDSALEFGENAHHLEKSWSRSYRASAHQRTKPLRDRTVNL
jgi:hypothetical protein